MRILRFAATAALTLIAAVVISLTARPALRHALLAELNDPGALPALESDGRIRFEPAARACAQEVAAILPGALRSVESEHGRPFAKAPLIGVYESFDTYARANGLGDSGVAGVSRAGRALLSPTLCGQERARLDGVLTHELSHIHFFGWRPRHAPRPPPWFTEGLAVMVSKGGGAEGVSDEEAAQAIRDGYAVILDDRPWFDFTDIRFEREPSATGALDAYSYRQRLAFRQAAVFIAWLRARDPVAFGRLLRSLESGAPFDEAFHESFRAAPMDCWRDYVGAISHAG